MQQEELKVICSTPVPIIAKTPAKELEYGLNSMNPFIDEKTNCLEPLNNFYCNTGPL